MAVLSEEVVKKLHEPPYEFPYRDLQHVMRDIICGELDIIAGRSEQFSYVFDRQEFSFVRSSFLFSKNDDKRFVLIWQSNKARPINEIYALCNTSHGGKSLLEQHIRNNFTRIFEWLPMSYEEAAGFLK